MPSAGRVGSAFAAELGTMAVTEQTDSLRMLGSDPVDYLVSPRVVACMIATPILTMMCFVMGAPSVHAASCKAWCWVPSWLDRYGAWPRTYCVDTAGSCQGFALCEAWLNTHTVCILTKCPQLGGYKVRQSSLTETAMQSAEWSECWRHFV